MFAPNDRTFEVLADRLDFLSEHHRYRSTVDEKAVTEALIEGLGAETITEVLLHHAFAGDQLTGKDILRGKTYSKLELANGQNSVVKVISAARAIR